MSLYDLSLEAAKGCRDFTKNVIDQKPDDSDLPPFIDMERYEEFNKELSDFYTFINMAVEAEFEVITIPEHHRTIFLAITKIGLKEALTAILHGNIR